jgi:hypothetical protein
MASIHVAAPRIQSVGNVQMGCEVGAERSLNSLSSAANSNENTTMKTYETKDFPLAAFLVTSGLPLQSHARQGKVSTFMFSETRQLIDLVSRYYGFQASVNPIAYANAFRNLKSIMYSNTTENDNMYHNQGHN